MRIQVLSDLHLEYGGEIPPLAPGAEVVVLAGDLAPAKHRAIRFPAEVWAGAEHILYVPGNHEFHGSDIEEARRMLALDCADCGVTLLDTGAVTIGHVRFIGATLWTDFRLESLPSRLGGRDRLTRSGGAARELDAHKAAGERLDDFTGAIRDREAPEGHGLLTTRETARRHARDLAFIEAEIAAAHEADPGSASPGSKSGAGGAGLEAVVVTHHAPSPVAVHYRHAGSPFNPAFVSDLEETIVHLRPALWIHGHVHHAVSATVGRTWILANPLGIGFLEEADFVPDLVIEL